MQTTSGKVNTGWVGLIAASLFAMLALGCSSQGGSSTPGPAASPASAPSPATPHYMVMPDRAGVALQRLRPAFSGEAEIHVEVSVIPSAHSCSDGTIYISTALLRVLDDDEVCAAVAHELGHLTGAAGADAGQRHALGGGSNEDRERQADAIAVTLLRRSGISPTVLARVLTIVRDAPQTRSELRPAITQRIGLLPSE